MQATMPFEFMQCITIARSTGKKAKGLRELRDMIAVVGPSSIHHHTCQYFLKGRVLDYTNDFAQWAGESLEERALSEHLSIVDPYDCADIEEPRKKLLGVIDEYMKSFAVPRDALPGNEFFFNEGLTVVFPAGLRAGNLAEFLMALKSMGKSSIYYHFYEARTCNGVDDFSTWVLGSVGKEKLAGKIRAIDPFMNSTEGVRNHIIRAVEDEIRAEMAGEPS